MTNVIPDKYKEYGSLFWNDVDEISKKAVFMCREYEIPWKDLNIIIEAKSREIKSQQQKTDAVRRRKASFDYRER